MCEDSRFVDRHFITIDLDPETERNVRHDERNKTLDDVQETMRHCDPLGDGYTLDPLTLHIALQSLRPPK